MVIKMNKLISILFMIFCLLSMWFVTRHEKFVIADTNVIYVPDQYPTIQEAINNATEGDMIFVMAGTYYEHVVVNKSVSLIGEDRESTIVDGSGTGIVINITASNVSLQGFTVINSGIGPLDSGIFVDRSSDVDVSYNIITNNFYGIHLQSSVNNVISDNIFSLNSFYGVSLQSSVNNTVSNNMIIDNFYGVSLHSSVTNLVSDNVIIDNFYGIVFFYSTNNVVSGNTIENNEGGMRLFSSSDNTIYHNNFNNTNQVLSSLRNVWDNGFEGNYWSDYTGVDHDQDGIGESPYVIDGSNQDNFPLMGMFYGFSVTLEEKMYHVAIISNSTVSNFRFERGPETGNKIIRFNVTSKDDAVGFCRIAIPVELMNYPFIVLVDIEEVAPTVLDISNETYVYFYLTYVHNHRTVLIISSKTLQLYNELLNKYAELNATYYGLLGNYSVLLGYYSVLLSNYTQLQQSYLELNSSYQEHLSDYSKSVQNRQNMMYIVAATTAVFLVTTVYLSKHAHTHTSKIRDLGE